MWKPWFLSRSPGTQLRLSDVLLEVMVMLDGGTGSREAQEEVLEKRKGNRTEELMEVMNAQTSVTSPPSSRVAPLRVMGGPSPAAVRAITLKM